MCKYCNITVNSLERVAYHEAAHLLLGVILGLKFEKKNIAIKIDWGKEHVTYIQAQYKRKDSINIIINKIICSFAGQIVEDLIFKNVFCEGIVDDNENIRKLLKHIKNKSFREEIKKICKTITKNILNSNSQNLNKIVNRLKVNLLFTIDEVKEILPQNISENNKNLYDIEKNLIKYKSIEI